MRKSVTSLVVFCVLALTACGNEKEFQLMTAAQNSQLQMVINYRKETNLRTLEKAAEVEKAKATALAEKYKADVERFKAIAKLGEKADAGGRVAIARSLEDKAGEKEVAAVSLAVPTEQPLSLPPLPQLKSASDSAKEWAGILLGGAQVFGNTYTAVKGLSAQVAINKQNNDAATAQHESTMNTFGTFSTNQASVGTAAVNAAAQSQSTTTGWIANIVEQLTKNPTTVINSTVNCPQNVASGSAGNGGNGGSPDVTGTGGNGGSPGTTGTGGLGGSPTLPTNGGVAGAGGNNVVTATQNCVGVTK